MVIEHDADTGFALGDRVDDYLHVGTVHELRRASHGLEARVIWDSGAESWIIVAEQKDRRIEAFHSGDSILASTARAARSLATPGVPGGAKQVITACNMLLGRMGPEDRWTAFDRAIRLVLSLSCEPTMVTKLLAVRWCPMWSRTMLLSLRSLWMVSAGHCSIRVVPIGPHAMRFEARADTGTKTIVYSTEFGPHESAWDVEHRAARIVRKLVRSVSRSLAAQARIESPWHEPILDAIDSAIFWLGRRMRRVWRLVAT